MIDVLEAAGLVANVMKGEVHEGKIHLRFTTDPRTGVKLTGVVGRKGMLEKHYYESLDLIPLEEESGKKIFLWHTAIEEFKPSNLVMMDAVPLSFLPKGFDYYAGGHVHVRMDKSPEGYGRITLPGSLFPVNFDELEKFGHGGIYLYDDTREEHLSWEPIKLYERTSAIFDCDGKSAEQVKAMVDEKLTSSDVKGHLVTLRFKGTLAGTKLSDLDFRGIFHSLYARGARAVVKNTLHLTTAGFEEVKVSSSTIEELEKQLIREHTGKIPLGMERQTEERLVLSLMAALDAHKLEGEKNLDFDGRILEEADLVVGNRT